MSDSQEPPIDNTKVELDITNPDELLQVIPRLLGFQPADDLVVIGGGKLNGREAMRVVMRYDLTDDPAEIEAVVVNALMAMRHYRDVHVALAVAYGPLAIAEPILMRLRDVCAAAELDVYELLRVWDGRWWTYTADAPDCCRIEGHEIDRSLSTAVLEMTEAGMTVYASREERATIVAPPTGERRSAAMQANLAAAIRMEKALNAVQRDDSAPNPVINLARRSVIDAMKLYREGGSLPPEELAWISLTITGMQVRDEAWARMTQQFARPYLQLWLDVLAVSLEGSVAPAASLAGLAAWQLGDGGLALMALDRALEVDANYTMALLIVDALRLGVRPEVGISKLDASEVARHYGLEPME